MDKDVKPNPHMSRDNPWDAYNKSVETFLATNPKIQNVPRICYELFMQNKDGQELMEILLNRFVFTQNFNVSDSNAPHSAMYWAGYSDCIKSLRAYGIEHKKHITEGNEACQT